MTEEWPWICFANLSCDLCPRGGVVGKCGLLLMPRQLKQTSSPMFYTKTKTYARTGLAPLAQLLAQDYEAPGLGLLWPPPLPLSRALRLCGRELLSDMVKADSIFTEPRTWRPSREEIKGCRKALCLEYLSCSCISPRELWRSLSVSNL